MFRAGVAERSVTFCGLPLLLKRLDIRLYSGERFLSNAFFLDPPFAFECEVKNVALFSMRFFYACFDTFGQAMVCTITI